MTTVDFTGSVSHGTMREEDLIPAFLDVVRRYDKGAYAEYEEQQVTEMLNDTFWSSEEAGWVLEDLFNAMEEIAPEWHYFGSHPGDGCDYGFWLHEDCGELLWDVEEFTQQAIEFNPAVITRMIADKLISVMTEFANREVGLREQVEARRTARSLLNRLDDITGG